jgi:hypothetical protein
MASGLATMNRGISSGAREEQAGGKGSQAPHEMTAAACTRWSNELSSSMHRPGTDPDHVHIGDVLCDFCHTPWRDELPVVEGHRGSVICGDCLTAAYRAVVLGEGPVWPPGYTCTLCLEQREDPAWRSHRYPEAFICARCIRQAAGVLHKDRDYDWQKPA